MSGAGGWVHRIALKAVEAAFAESGQCVDDRVVSSKIEDEATKAILSPSDTTQHYDLLNGLVLFNRMTHCKRGPGRSPRAGGPGRGRLRYLPTPRENPMVNE